MMKVIYALLLPLIIVSSCGNAKESVVTDKNSEQEPSEFSVLIQESYGGLENKEERIITTHKELEEAYGIINRFRRPGVPIPKIDFKKHIVVALFMGEKTTGGFSIEVKSISIIGDELLVGVLENGPKPTDMVTMAICQPFCFVKIPKPKEEKIVTFEKI